MRIYLLMCRNKAERLPVAGNQWCVVCYTLLVEGVMQKPVRTAFIYIAPRYQLVRVNVTDALKNLSRTRLGQIRDVVHE